MQVKIFQNHRQGGIEHPAGSIIDLPDDDANWLLGIQGAQRAQAVEEHRRGTKRLQDAGVLPTDGATE